ncbi:MAG: hypothetical protein H6815_02005 [Phycisphaeraceae bacterium]|nr:hypothetical protein [Phycisphaerales bacterium]MCB9859203.1 hypothetical protein [Phycisphaeraceae bacterium]
MDLMCNDQTPTFEEWVEYCFTQGYADFSGYSEDIDTPAADVREIRFHRIHDETLTDYLIRLFVAPEFIADRYTDDQIADATWFLFGIASSYLHHVRESIVPVEKQITCLRAVASMYLNLYDKVCGDRGRSPDIDLTSLTGNYSHTKIDGAVYMIWDMDCISSPFTFPKEFPHLVDPGFEVLSIILQECKLSTCHISALHGLGHEHYKYPDRCEAIIDQFLSTRRIPEWVREYALLARVGGVM